MGLITQNNYQYYTGGNQGDYQFVSLDSIIAGFLIAYVGQNKIIPKANPSDVRFHALRAAQELSYDVLRSFKNQEIEVPPTLKMMLPQDYVNYVKLTRSDANGIERVLYPTGKTSNPFPIKQLASGDYDFGLAKRSVRLVNSITGTFVNGDYLTLAFNSTYPGGGQLKYCHFRFDTDGSGSSGAFNQYTNPTGEGQVIGIEVDSLTAPGIATAIANNINDLGHHTAIASTDDDGNGVVDIIYNEYLVGTPANEGVYKADGTAGAGNNANGPALTVIENGTGPGTNIQAESADSNTWTKYKAYSSGETNDYENDDFELDARGRRYGLDPQHSQQNGTFYIDSRAGFIHFGSSLAGKTIVLHYVSDGMGTDAEMVVHKFAEEAVYKSIAYGMVSTRSNMPDFIVNRFKKERFAETRKAKIRLSNIKIEEFTQVLKGMSKQIK